MSETNNRPLRVFISTPCYGGLCLEKYMIGIVKLQLELIKEGIQLVLDTTENESLVKYIDKYPNLIVTRTFSKGFGAAGCRVGMVFSNEKNIELISKFRQMYEVTNISMKYCEFLLNNQKSGEVLEVPISQSLLKSAEKG